MGAIRTYTQLGKNNYRAYRIRRYLRKRGIKVYTRKQWGSQHLDVYRTRRLLKPVTADPADTLVQHITVTFDSGVFVGDFKTDMQTVERIGFERFGSGVSYNFVVDMATGEIGEGQPLDAKGTHTINDKKPPLPNFSFDQNAVARAVAVLGMPTTPLSLKGERSLLLLMQAMVKFKALTPGFDYMPHSAFTAKDCPCDPTRKKMAFLRSMV